MSKLNLDELKSVRLEEMFSDIELEPTSPLVASTAEVEAWLDQIQMRNEATRVSTKGVIEDVKKMHIICPSCGNHYDLPEDTSTFICIHCFRKFAIRRKGATASEQDDVHIQPQSQVSTQEEESLPWYKSLLRIFSRNQ